MAHAKGSHSFTCHSHIYPQMEGAILPLLRKHSPDGATPDCSGHLIADYYSFIDLERIKGWVGLVGWPCSGRFISGHPSAAGWVQDRESLLAKDRRSTTVPCNQPQTKLELHFLLLKCLLQMVVVVVQEFGMRLLSVYCSRLSDGSAECRLWAWWGLWWSR